MTSLTDSLMKLILLPFEGSEHFNSVKKYINPFAQSPPRRRKGHEGSKELDYYGTMASQALPVSLKYMRTQIVLGIMFLN